MFGLLYYKYIEWTKGVLFNGEKSTVNLILSLECVVYIFLFFLYILSNAPTPVN